MLYSRACEYAIRALTYLALRDRRARSACSRRRHPLKEIAAQEEIPPGFLAKILQALVRAGLLVSWRGPQGGFSLARPARQITLYHIRAAIDGTEDLERCAAGLTLCSDSTPCPLHRHWKPLRLQISSYLKSTTLADMAQALQEGRAQARGEGVDGAEREPYR